MFDTERNNISLTLGTKYFSVGSIIVGFGLFMEIVTIKDNIEYQQP